MPEDKYAKVSAYLEVPVVGARDYVHTHKTPYYFRTMDIAVKNIDKYYNTIWSTIYKSIGVPYFGEVKLFLKEFIDKCKNHPNDPQKIPTEINNNIKIFPYKNIYAQVVMIHCKITVQKGKTGKP